MDYHRYTFSATPAGVRSLTHCVLTEDFKRAQPHFHPFLEIFFVMKGELILEADADYRVSAGEFAVVPAGITHRERTASNAPCEQYILAVDGGGRLAVCPFRRFYNEAAALLAQAAAYAATDEPYNAEIAEALARAAAYKALQTAESGDAPVSAVADGDTVSVKNYIDGNFGSEITLGRLAAVACRSAEHLIRTFRRAYGVSPMRYLKRRRIAEGKTLLESTAMNVSQITSLIGYNSAAQFAADFKAATGVTPTAYRAAQKQQVRA